MVFKAENPYRLSDHATIEKSERIVVLEKIINDRSNDLNTFVAVVEQFNDPNFILKKTGFDIVFFKDFFKEKVPLVFKNIEDLVKNKGINVTKYDSFSDDFSNQIPKVALFLERVNKNLIEGKEISETSINMLKGVFDSIQLLVYYIDEISNDENKLILEISEINGFLEKYKNYFKSVIPTKSKLLAFRFFSELEKGNIKNDNLLEKIKEVDNEGLFLNTDKIIKDFNDGILIEDYANTNN